MKTSTDHEEYIRALREEVGDDLVDEAIKSFQKRVGYATTREKARFLMHVFEPSPAEDPGFSIYGLNIREMRAQLDLPLTWDDV